MTFIHLRVHSEYSMVDGIVRIKPLMEQLKSLRMPAVAVTDQTNLFAAVKWIKKAQSLGIKPIIGCDIALHNPDDLTKPFSLLLLCQNTTGYNNLTRLVSMAYMQGNQQGLPQIQKSWLEQYNGGLIALSGAVKGDIGQAIVQGKMELAQEFLDYWKDLFADRFYLEIQRTGRAGEMEYLKAAVDLARIHRVPLVATNDVCFLNADDYHAHEARICIHDGCVLNAPGRAKRYSPEQYLKTTEQMSLLFDDIPSAIHNSFEIAKRCTLELELGKSYLPNFPIPEGMTVNQYLCETARRGLQKRLEQLFYDKLEQLSDLRKPYDHRLEIELDVINKMGFPGYFLIVADFIQWAKDCGIPVGPGRGSGAGSLVAYSLQITDLDPLEYELLFERFLNPERVSMPDFDIDFCMEGRDRVIEYVAKKYGRMSVSQIITFGTMAAKAVVRDVGRVLSHPYGFVDKIAKLIPFELGMTLTKALEQEEELRKRYEQEEEVKELIDLALKLEGITRNAGKHAGGVVIAPSELTDFTAIYCEQGSEQIVSQFDKDDVEAAGLVKFDFLGLRTLTIIDWALKTVNKSRSEHNQEPIDITTIATDDGPSFDLLRACQTTAVFQLESRGMKDLIHRLQPDCFEDIIALVALFRPGPLQSGMVDDFINRKHGRAQVEYPHPDLEPILKPTYGVILYQEQVMQIAQVLANYTLGGADLLRRAMGKKKPEEMAKQREIFTQGAIERGVEEETATHIFDLMEKFAGYGFNKSHSAAYALVAYQTAWLKAHYPAAFMAAVLSSDMDNTDKVVIFIEECRQLAIVVKPPCINQSFHHFTVASEQNIIYGLGAIKGVGANAIEAIIAARGESAYASLFDFCRRVDLRKVNRRVIEALIRSGAMDEWQVERAVLFASINKALKMAEQYKANHRAGQQDLFSLLEEDSCDEEEYPSALAWSDQERLFGERETLGLFLSGHPVDQYRAELKPVLTCRLNQLNPSRMKQVVVIGLVHSVRHVLTKRGKKMAIVCLDDGDARVDVSFFAETFEEKQELLTKDAILVVQGEVSEDKFNGGVRLSGQQLHTVEQAREEFASHLTLVFHQQDEMKLTQLKTLLKSYSGSCKVVLNYSNEDAQAKVILGTRWHVNPCDDLIAGIVELLGDKVALSW